MTEIQQVIRPRMAGGPGRCRHFRYCQEDLRAYLTGGGDNKGVGKTLFWMTVDNDVVAERFLWRVPQ